MKIKKKIIVTTCDHDCDEECGDNDKCLSCKKLFCWIHEGRENRYCCVCKPSGSKAIQSHFKRLMKESKNMASKINDLLREINIE
ncbi:MAG: hypothetical protein ACTSRU_11575, partial [Candidatus Hodarchaeales archaeon]